ncbi:MAG: ABC transporter permease subunit, partial [Proteobacteria bacterium]
MNFRALRLVCLAGFLLWLIAIYVFPALFTASQLVRVDLASAQFHASPWTRLWMPIKLAGTSTVLSLGVGAACLALFPVIASHRLAHTLESFFLLPTPLVLAMFLFLARKFELGFGFYLVVSAQVFLNGAYLGRQLFQARLTLPKREIEIAQTLGANPGTQFSRILFPHYVRRTLPGLAQVFLWCLGSFALVLILGGGPPVESLQTETLAALRAGPDAWKLAFVWMSIEWLVSLIVIASALQNRRVSEGSVVGRFPKSRLGNTLGWFGLAIPLTILALDFSEAPLSFAETAPFWQGLGRTAFFNSVSIGLSVAVITTLGAVLVLAALRFFSSLQYF